MLTEETRVQAEVIGEEIVLQGVFRGAVRGRCIRVDASGEVDASLVCAVAEILGRFEGTIEAELLRFGPTAVAQGVFEVDRLMVAEGAIVNGSFNVEVEGRIAMPGRVELPAGKEASKAQPRKEPALAAAGRTTA